MEGNYLVGDITAMTYELVGIAGIVGSVLCVCVLCEGMCE